ncbi:MAG: rhodanese-like domain-containing protein [Acidobacteriota bacterium]|jgi:rhodanese-related sulfurtransferase|nr:rhodanese-like domain-containing protein [Acidobacteriota bacterium]NLT32178.1 rhodanese-like domain-containing protein [Acidobacteriota bacterium]
MKINGLATLMMTLLLLPAIGVAAAEENVVLPEIPRISVEELKKMVDDGGDFIVVDVRDAGSYTAGHIKGAINIYYDSTGDPMERQMMLMALPMDKLVVTYCDCTDDASSAMIADELYILGYERDKIKVLSGGSLRWVELGHPMVASN